MKLDSRLQIDGLGSGFITFKNHGYGLRATIKWDGCASIEFEDEDNPMHVCDFDAFADVLAAMKVQALDFFGGEFLIGVLNDEQLAEKKSEYGVWTGSLVLPMEPRPS